MASQMTRALRQQSVSSLSSKIPASATSRSSSATIRVLSSCSAVQSSSLLQSSPSQQKFSLKGTSAGESWTPLLLLAGASAAAVATTTTTATCEEAPSESEKQPTNPLWPSGVSSEMVDRYVDSLIENPDINIQSIPDRVERILYASTVRLTLNAVYQAISNLHGIEFMGHTLELQRSLQETPQTQKVHHLLTTNTNVQKNVDAINIQKLDELADALLATTTVNSKFVPDKIEKQVYINILRLVFTLLEAVSETLSIDFCGHEVSLSFEPTTEATLAVQQQIQEQQQTTTSLQQHSHIDNDILDQLVNDTVAESLGDEDGDTLSILEQLSPYRFFLKALHRTLYGLILGVMENVLSQTELILLEDCIKINLTSLPKNKTKKNNTNKSEMHITTTGNTTATKQEDDKSSSSLEMKIQELVVQNEKAKQQAQTAKIIAAATTTTSLAILGFALAMTKRP